MAAAYHLLLARGMRRRRRARGFTLMELMVVVVLVAILAMLAAPSMTTARNDRIAFDYARQTSSLFHEARARSFGRGAAHLVLFSTATTLGTRGAVFLFEALDGAAAPGPSATCRSVAQWAWARDFLPGATQDTTNRSRMVDFLNINGTAASTIQVIEDIRMEGATIAPDGTRTPVTVIAMCTTPNGTTYVGTGSTPTAALTALVAAEPFRDIVAIDVARHRGAAVAGLTRRIILAGGGAPRIQSR
jgi:prepilin-type N-terminal cleavage/methylation domain-containing protein